MAYTEMNYTVEEIAYLFGLSLDELVGMTLTETPEYLIRTDEETPEEIHALVSNGYGEFLYIADNIEYTHVFVLNGDALELPGGVLLEVLAAMEAMRNGEYETVH
jgi:hypothetical protein